VIRQLPHSRLLKRQAESSLLDEVVLIQPNDLFQNDARPGDSVRVFAERTLVRHQGVLPINYTFFSRRPDRLYLIVQIVVFGNQRRPFRVPTPSSNGSHLTGPGMSFLEIAHRLFTVHQSQPLVHAETTIIGILRIGATDALH